MVMFSFCFSLTHPATELFGRGFSRSHCILLSTVRIVSFRLPADFQKLSGFDFLGLDPPMLRRTTYPLPCSAFDLVSLGQPLSSIG